jgi:hypothetical protein
LLVDVIQHDSKADHGASMHTDDTPPSDFDVCARSAVLARAGGELAAHSLGKICGLRVEALDRDQASAEPWLRLQRKDLRGADDQSAGAHSKRLPGQNERRADGFSGKAQFQARTVEQTQFLTAAKTTDWMEAPDGILVERWQAM